MKNNMVLLTALVKLIEIASDTGTSTYTEQISSLLVLTNAVRTKIGLQPLKMNDALNKLALVKSQDMVKSNYFSHKSPNFGSSFDMMRSHEIGYIIAGENLAIGESADHVHSAWMDSKTHRENILNPSFKEIGIGICAKGSKSYAYTQFFIG
jgi:uncharacterized YkwD family protein